MVSHRTHWTTTALLRREAAWHLVAALVARPEAVDAWLQHECGRVAGRVRVDVTFVYPTRRRRDPDGLAGLVKPLLDVLVARGLLRDDDSEHVELAVRAVTERGVTATRIRLEAA